MPPARICAGGRGKPRSLPRPNKRPILLKKVCLSRKFGRKFWDQPNHDREFHTLSLSVGFRAGSDRPTPAPKALLSPRNHDALPESLKVDPTDLQCALWLD